MSQVAATIWVFCGVLLIILAYLDIFLTVLHPTVESPLSNRFQRGTWSVLRLLGRAFGRGKARTALLNLGLPLMVAGLIVLWLVLILIGFACIYYPWIGNPAVFSSNNPLSGSFLDALYYSGVTLATLGYGDIQPLIDPFRGLAVLQALTGSVTVSASVAYILGVYPTLARQRTLARTVNAEVAGQIDALPLLRRYLGENGRWHPDLFTQLRELALALMEISESYETHPVLYYAHPRHVQHSFARVLVTSQSIVAALRFGLSVDDDPETVRNPQILFLEQSLDYCLNQLAASIHIDISEQRPDDAERARLIADYNRLCDELEQLELRTSRQQRSPAVPVLVKDDVEADARELQPERAAIVDGAVTYEGEPEVLDPALDLGASSPAEAYAVFRSQSDPLLTAYAAACGYTMDEVRASSATTWWTGRR